MVFLRLAPCVQATSRVWAARALSTVEGSAQEQGLVELRALGGGVTLYGLRAPRTRNALGRALLDAMRDAHRALRADARCSAVVLHSLVPGVFCAGADLKERARMDDAQVCEFVRELRGVLAEVERLPMCTVAAVAGAALGGGLELALACDLRVAHARARLGLVETARGLLPGAGGTQRLPRLVSPALAKELIFTARVLGGAEARALGLANHAVDDADAEATAEEATLARAVALAREVAANAPLAVRAAKRAVDQGLPLPLAAGYEVEQRCYEDNVSTRDRLEGLRAFLEKRPPVFEGR